MSSPRNVNVASGLLVFRSIDLDESEEEVKGSAGSVFWLHVANRNAAERFLKIYDATAAGTTVGTTTPDVTVPLPASSALQLDFGPYGLHFASGITVAATTGIADSDTGAPGANEVVVNVGYA